MRCVLILALAALLASVASAITCQADAQAVETRWKNCSEVVHGRLGTLHPVLPNGGDLVLAANWTTKGALVPVTVKYSPCVLSNGFFLQVQVPGDVSSPYNFDDAGNTEQVVDFHMPEKRGDVPYFTATYRNSVYGFSASVTTKCDNTVGTAMITAFNKTYVKNHYDFAVTIATKEACARFPYTNESMPPGGVAALVIIILCFVIQFGICGWYHKTVKMDNPFTTAEGEYTNIE